MNESGDQERRKGRGAQTGAMDAEKIFDMIQYLFIIKTLTTIGIEGK